jgi:mitochondrial fission protein ELM1
MTLASKLRILVLGNGLAGSEVQAIGLAQRLLQRSAPSHRGDYRVERFPPRSSLFRRMPNRMLACLSDVCGDAYLGFDKRAVEKSVAEFAPNIVIGCGRSTAVLNRAMKLHHPGLTSVQILNPYLGAKALASFDVIALPRHDNDDHGGQGNIEDVPGGGGGPPIMKWISGAIHDKTGSLLEEAKQLHGGTIGSQPAPRVTVLVGAPHRHSNYTVKQLQSVVEDLNRRVEAAGGSLCVLASRRTPPEMLEALSSGPGRFWGPGSPPPNPYVGALALSDALVVTPDSITMAREALSAAPRLGTYLMMPETTRGKFRRFFHEYLCAVPPPSREQPENEEGGVLAAKTHFDVDVEEQLHLSPCVSLLKETEAGDDDVEELVDAVLNLLFSHQRHHTT